MPQQVIKYFIAGADLTGKEGLAAFLDGSASETAKLATDGTLSTFIGIIKTGAPSGELVEIVVWGEANAITSYQAEPGDWLTPTTDGELKAWAVEGEYPVARYLPPIKRGSNNAVSMPDSADGAKVLVFVNFYPGAFPAA